MNHVQIRKTLVQHNVRPSAQRVYIMARLIEQPDHPTAEMVYQSVVQQLSTLSRTTVYNTMNALADAGVVRVITIEENEMRYDANTQDHGHFRCEACEKVSDFDIVALTDAGLDGYEITERNVYYSGKCKNCADIR